MQTRYFYLTDFKRRENGFQVNPHLNPLYIYFLRWMNKLKLIIIIIIIIIIINKIFLYYNIPSKIDIYNLKVEKRAIKTYLQFNI